MCSLESSINTFFVVLYIFIMVDRVNLDLAVMIDHYLHQPVFFPYGVLEIWISWFNDHLFAI
jgi:hypothetical protein